MLQSRGDELIVWINYQSKPEQSVEAACKGDRQFAKPLNDKDKPALTVLDGIHGLQVAMEAKPGVLAVDKVQSFVNSYPSNVIRLAIRPEKPHIYLRTNLRLMWQLTAGELFKILKDLVGK